MRLFERLLSAPPTATQKAYLGEVENIALAYLFVLVTRKSRPADASESHDLLVCNPQIDYKTGTMRLREFCGSQSCFVVLSGALGSICNGHPASDVVGNQEVTK
jgi:hypothetical protein